MSLASAGAGINLIQIGEELFWPSRRGTSWAFQVQHDYKEAEVTCAPCKLNVFEDPDTAGWADISP